MAKNRGELVKEIAGKTEASQATVNSVLEEFFNSLVDSVQRGEDVTIPGYLSVKRTERSARTGRNPQTGETIQIPAGYSVRISAGSKLKKAVK